MMDFEATVNGSQVRWAIPPGEVLTETLRSHGLIGTKRGCESGDCGACAVLLDGREVNSCVLLSAQASGHQIVTIEHLGTAVEPHPIQEAFIENGAIQCGFCTPGMILATSDLLSRNPAPTAADAREALAGHLCRCTGYVKPIDAVLDAAERVRCAGRK